MTISSWTVTVTLDQDGGATLAGAVLDSAPVTIGDAVANASGGRPTLTSPAPRTPAS